MLKIPQKQDFENFKRQLDSLQFPKMEETMQGESYLTCYFHFEFKNKSKKDKIINFLLNGGQIQTALLFGFFNNEVLNYLVSKKIFQMDIQENIVLSHNYSLIKYRENYFFVGNAFCCNKNNHLMPFLGVDSFLLSEHIFNTFSNKSGKLALDLCCGSSIQAVSLSHFFDKVIAVDIDSESVRTAKINILINGLRDKIKVKESDLSQYLKNDRNVYYDTIVANPPFVSVPSFFREFYPTYAYAGFSGLQIVESIIKQTRGKININGHLMMIGMTLETKDTHNFKELAEKLMPNYQISMKLFDSLSVEEYCNFLTNYDKKNLGSFKIRDWIKMYQKKNIIAITGIIFDAKK